MKRLFFPIAAFAIALAGCATPDDTAVNNDANKGKSTAEAPKGEDPNTMSLAGNWRATFKGPKGEQVVKLSLVEGGNASIDLVDPEDASKSATTSGHWEEKPSGVEAHFHGEGGKEEAMTLELKEGKLKTTQFDIAKWGGDGLEFERA